MLTTMLFALAGCGDPASELAIPPHPAGEPAGQADAGGEHGTPGGSGVETPPAGQGEGGAEPGAEVAAPEADGAGAGEAVPAAGGAGAGPGAADGSSPAGEAASPEENCRLVQGDDAPTLPEGPRTRVRGIIRAVVGGTASILMEVMDEKAGAERTVASLECVEAGPFSIELPNQFGAVRLVVFLDADGNGPSAEDPAGMGDPVKLGGSEVKGVEIAVREGTKLGRFAPLVATPGLDGE